MTTRLGLLTLSRTSSRCRPWRRMHQAVARPQPSSGLSNEYLHSLYEDLMIPDRAPWSGADLLPPKQPQPVSDATPSPSGVSNGTVDVLLAEYATKGNTQDVELSLSRLSEPPTEHQRDLHVKAHIVNASLPTHPSSLSTTQRFPTSALAILHEYESSGHFAPVKAYTRVISALFNVQTSPSSDPGLGRAAAEAQAWDLFAHMRYVAHPVPDAHLYALMIRACGSFSRSEPERALDLWAEMLENGVEPTKGAYEAIIKVCGRAGQEWLGEGMRLAREMNDRYSIGRGLWCALLEGCKRVGDLNKARWILAEAVRGDGTSNGDSMLDAELMTHIFHTYASYKPPFKRETTRLIDRNGELSSSDSQVEETSDLGDMSGNLPAEQTGEGDVSPDVLVENVENTPSFSRLPPQTSSDVIAETRALFDRILQDKFPSLGGTRAPQGGFLLGRFAHVELSHMLLNAYLSVFYSHASIEASQEAFDFLFSENHLFGGHVFHPDEHSCIDALERCATARAEDRRIAARWAEDVWRRWEAIEAKGLSEGKENVGSFARFIEKTHAAMRRVLILSGDIDGALALLRSFVARYPPKTVLRPTDPTDDSSALVPARQSTTGRLFARPPILSTRTSLTNPAASTARPLVRLTSAVARKDDRVPPIIAFGDVDLLHARLVEHGRLKEVGYVKWVCISYATALKKRRAEYIGVY